MHLPSEDLREILERAEEIQLASHHVAEVLGSSLESVDVEFQRGGGHPVTLDQLLLRG
jgi:hypothetical protein